MNQKLVQNINKTLKEAKSKGVTFKNLAVLCGVKPRQYRELRECIRFLEAKGLVIDRTDRVFHTDYMKIKLATVIKLNKTFGFVRLNEDDSQMFIPGRYLMGALVGDTVFVTPVKSRGELPEGEVVRIVKHGNSEFTGTLVKEDGAFFIKPDSMMKMNIPISARDIRDAQDGDKLLCEISSRGVRHSEHRASVVNIYGDSQTAQNCANALLDANRISMDFPSTVKSEAVYVSKRGILESDFEGRDDLRDQLIFTIDGANTKDIDDAISIKKLDDCYVLGVHIADVSHYVKLGSKLEEEAYNRGTSIYFSDRVIPMLPPELSNGICSLNPNEDRLAFSCIMTVTLDGKLQDFDFKKTVIRSYVKGVYSEINQILNHSEDDEIKQKYDGLYDSIFLMKELANILSENKRRRGAPEIETSESYIVLDENGATIDVKLRERGASEVIIEEFMLMANEAAATAARLKEVPFVYRVHEPPSEEKLEILKNALTVLGIECQNIKPDIPALELAQLISKVKDTPIYPIVNTLVLRSMSKAKYFEIPLGHYGLVLENYAQFTSPIRRYPDLTIHRILSELAVGTPPKKITAKFEKFVVKSARRSTETELQAMRLERDCDDIYKAEYMKSKIGEEFDAIISSVSYNGIYVMLPNSVEGLIKEENLPKGEYQYDEMFEYKNILSGKTYRIGDPIRVICIKADVNLGNVDFAEAE